MNLVDASSLPQEARTPDILRNIERFGRAPVMFASFAAIVLLIKRLTRRK